MAFKDTFVDVLLVFCNLLARNECHVRNLITASFDKDRYNDGRYVVLCHVFNADSERFDGSHSKVVAHLIFFKGLDNLRVKRLGNPRAAECFCDLFAFLDAHFTYSSRCVGQERTEQSVQVFVVCISSELDGQVTNGLEDCHSDSPVLVFCGVLKKHNQSWAEDLLADNSRELDNVLSYVETHVGAVVLQKFLEDGEDFLLA